MSGETFVSGMGIITIEDMGPIVINNTKSNPVSVCLTKTLA